MFRYAAIFGGIAGTIVIAILSIGLLADGMGDFASTEWFGYLVMLVVLSLIFVGIKRYRDNECGGVIRFGKAFGLGAMIAAIAGLFYALGWEISLAATDYAFVEEYSAAMVRRAEGLPDAEAAALLAQVEQFRSIYVNPALRMGITFLEIFPVGLVVALVSALLLRNPRVLPARRAA